ncbi:YslB family protein [Priestia koreensis]|uniref:YslB family protein n=1 Tax=Priestia koreensis TaxID=284581 RepID=UPI001F5A1E58|nr:YslB family protein [Priestia koreensis]MCM3002733.1 YslB family protein [Priestia koreensis]UNL84430.1 YslB family protein [Priestia koreensis]
MSNVHTEEEQTITEQKEHTDTPPISDSMSVPYFGYQLIRDVLLPDLLGKDTEQILYWAGKNIARKHPVETPEEIVMFFIRTGWGALSLLKQDKNEMELEISGPMVEKRLKENKGCSFHLEAGFIAQQIQQQNQCVAEAYLTLKERAHKVMITVKWDKKDKL